MHWFRYFNISAVFPKRVIFDNGKVAAKDGFGAHARKQAGYAALAAHYGFEAVFCNPASGNEKGLVEGLVGYIRLQCLCSYSQSRNHGRSEPDAPGKVSELPVPPDSRQKNPLWVRCSQGSEKSCTLCPATPLTHVSVSLAGWTGSVQSVSIQITTLFLPLTAEERYLLRLDPKQLPSTLRGSVLPGTGGVWTENKISTSLNITFLCWRRKAEPFSMPDRYRKHCPLTF